MADDITILGADDVEGRVRRELERPLGAERQRRYRRFLLAALGSVPWVGGLIAASATLDGEREQQKINDLEQEWLDEHSEKLKELGVALLEILQRLETLGDDIQARIQTDEYLGLVRQAFRVWDQADTREKRKLIQNLLTN